MALLLLASLTAEREIKALKSSLVSFVSSRSGSKCTLRKSSLLWKDLSGEVYYVGDGHIR